MRRRPLLAAVVAAVTTLVATVGISTAGSTTAEAAAVTPMRASFYYPWFPETEGWASQYTPTLGKYDSSNQTILAAHVAMAKYAGLDAFISSWWGQGTKTAQRLPLLLNAARAQQFHIAPYYEPESNNPPPTDTALKADFDYLYGLTTDDAWLKVAGKPVLFVYNTGAEGSCAGVARLQTASAGRFYLNAKVFSGYKTCATQPDSWHQYGPAAAYDLQTPYSATVSAGFYKFNESTPRLARDLTRFKTDLGRQVASGTQWQLTYFNEFGEGSSVEPATAWQSPSGMGDYLDAMRAAYTGTTPPTTSSSSVPTSSTTIPSSTTTGSTSSTTSPPTSSSSQSSSDSASSSASSTPTSTSVSTTSSSTSTTSSTTSPTSSTSVTSTPTTTTAPPGNQVTKILTIVEENHSLAQMQAGMPYLFSQAQTYGYATNYTAIRHPSLPNYLAMAGGSTFGVTDDAAPSAHPITGPSVFGAAITAGKTAKAYQESMTTPCRLSNSGQYAVKHNPWAYFTDERTQCNTGDIPTGTVTAGALRDDIVNGTLPNVGYVTPNLCNDAHDCPLTTADNWLKAWMQLIYASPDWASGHLAVIITADEDNGSQGNKVLTVVIHPSQNHNVVTTALTHYSWTRAMTQLTGAPCILAACTAPDMAAAFALPLT